MGKKMVADISAGFNTLKDELGMKEWREKPEEEEERQKDERKKEEGRGEKPHWTCDTDRQDHRDGAVA